MSTFRLCLKLHSPVALPQFVPRLDTLLQEAMSRVAQDWTRQHDLPLAFDDPFGGYRGSQILFATTEAMPMQATHVACVSSPGGLKRNLVTNKPKHIQEDGGPYLKRLTKTRAYLSPYLLFYGDGDGERCAELLELLDGIGREHNRSAGSFAVDSIEADPDDLWRWRSAGTDLPISRLPYAPIRSHERLTPFGVAELVVRPPRVVRSMALIEAEGAA